MKCPKCHCQNFRVLATRAGEDSKTRRRICRSCGYVFHTCEFVTSNLTPDSILEEMIRKINTDDRLRGTGSATVRDQNPQSGSSAGSGPIAFYAGQPTRAIPGLTKTGVSELKGQKH